MIKQTLFLSGINLSGKLLGLLKIIVLASIYGAGSVYDAYIIAYTLPTVLPQILTTIITTIFIPQFHKKSRVSIESWEGLNVLFTFVVTLSFSLTMVLYVYAGSIVPMLAPGADDKTLEMAISLFKVMSISTFIIGVSSFFIALSNATEKFYLASIDSLIINSIVIAYCFIYTDESDIEIITYLLIIGFCIHLFIMIYSNREVVLSKIRFNLNYKHEDFKNPMSKSIPIVVGYVGAVSSGIVDQWFSSYEDMGSISVLSYAAMLYLLPMEVFGKAIMQTYFTRFSSLSNDKTRLINSYSEGIKLILFIIIPVSIYLLISNQSLIGLIFQRGNFTDADAYITSNVLSALALGLVFRIVAYYNYRLLHSAGQSWMAISIGLIEVLVNIIFNYLLSPSFGLVGIALATTISLLASSFISCLLLKKYYAIQYLKFIDFNFLKIVLSSLVCVFSYDSIISNELVGVCSVGELCYILINVSLIAALPILFFAICYFLKVREIIDIIKYIGYKNV